MKTTVLWIAAMIVPLAGCSLPILGGGDASARTVEGDAEWVASVVAAVFREAGIPVERIGTAGVSSGSFYVQDPWLSSPLDTRVECSDGDIPLDGAFVVLEVEAVLSERTAGRQPGRQPDPTDRRPPEGLPPSPVPVGRSTGLQTRVALSSRGTLLYGDDASCRLRDSFEEELLGRVALRTGGREIATGNAPADGE